jgi:DNA polymerase-3 subunit chi
METPYKNLKGGFLRGVESLGSNNLISKKTAMTKVNFYHLTSSPIGKALPKLLEKAIASNARVVVQAESEDKVAQLNSELWTYTTKFFLPHGAKEDGFADQQPIYLTASNENPNGATILAIAENAVATDMDKFEKCLYMFDGNDASQLQTARSRWKEYKEAGFEVTYWQQNAKGGWEEGGK